MRTLLLLAVTVGSMARATNTESNLPEYCRPADQVSDFLVKRLKDFATASSGPEVRVRQRTQLPQVAAAQVFREANEEVCLSAAVAYDQELVRLRGTSPQQRQVYVIRVGEKYVVVDPTAMAGEWQTGMVFSSNFDFLSQLAL